MTLVEAELNAQAPASGQIPKVMRAAWAHAVLAPGKRIRPLLVMAACADLGVADLADALVIGCSLEFAHTASLILDDLPCMDDARLRRGRPTLHRAFGESTAILTAIALLNQAHECCASVPVRGLGRALSRAIGYDGLVTGQFRDLNPHEIAADEITRTYAQKTGALFVAGCEMAGLLAAADAQTAADLHGFADAVGVAFQITDDMVDANATSASAGKDVGKDGAVATLQRITSAGIAEAERERCIVRARHRLALLGPSEALDAWLTLVLG